MVLMPVIQLSNPVCAVRVVDDSLLQDGVADAANSSVVEQIRELEQQKRLYQDTCAAMQKITDELRHLYNEMFAEHNEAIARLSVEIARKVLMQNIQDGDYDIESIIKEALKNVPESGEPVVRLNPDDLSDLRQLQQAGNASLSEIKLIADPNIGRAECVVESSKGMVQLFIDEHLNEISKALIKAR